MLSFSRSDLSDPFQVNVLHYAYSDITKSMDLLKLP